VRTYTGILLFEDLFDNVPDGYADIQNLARSIFTPTVSIVETDCRTTLGKFEIANFPIEGLVELATDIRLSQARISQILSGGVYEVATRHTSTCISKGGLCAKCYAATYPADPVPKVNDFVTVRPEYVVTSEIVETKLDVKTYVTTTDPTTYIKHYAFCGGVLLTPGTDYLLVNGVLTLLVAPTDSHNIVFRFIKLDTNPFLIWLAQSYSGSIFGIAPIISLSLPLRSLLLSSLMSENRLQLIGESIKQIASIPQPYAEYIDQIKDPLEKALYMIALYCIYSNVST
jgi:hypothetical protein